MGLVDAMQRDKVRKPPVAHLMILVGLAIVDGSGLVPRTHSVLFGSTVEECRTRNVARERQAMSLADAIVKV